MGIAMSTVSLAQTPGLIFKPATAPGNAVLNPNGDGYTSATASGFSANDKTESEIPYAPLTFPGLEPTSDLGPGPDCGFTDFVDSGTEDPALSYFDGTNLLFRLRLGKAQPNSKGYSILIDTDQKFGSSGVNADPNATVNNPGFEIEINLQTNFGVFVYNVDGTCSGSPSSSFAGETNYQKSIAVTTNCGDPDYFYDFYVPFSALTALGINSSTPMRMAIVTQMNPQPAVCNNALSDFGGVDDAAYGNNPASIWANVIDNFPPTSVTNINTQGLDRSLCPVITSPIAQNTTSVSGTSTHADGTVIKVFKNGTQIGSTTVSAGAWTLSGIAPALVSTNIITASATAPGKSESISNCNPVTVAVTCSSGPPNVSLDAKGACGTGATVGALIRIYKEGVIQTPNATGSSGASGNAVTVQSDGTWRWKCNTNTNCNGGANCLVDGYYTFTQQVSPQCESVQVLGTCFGGAVATATPVITTSPVLTTTTSISGTSASGATIYLYANGTQIATTTAVGTAWTMSSLSLTFGQAVTAKAITTGQCLSAASTAINVGRASLAPIVSGTYCTSSTITSVTGTSTEPAGTAIQVFKNGVANGSATAVAANGTWTANSGISISPGEVITARATVSGGTQSPVSNSVTVGGKTSSAVSLTAPIIEGATSVSGTGTNGNVIRLYVDGFQVGATATVASGIWTLSGLGAFDIYAGGVVTATATSTGNCESNPSTAVTVQCIAPLTTLSVDPPSVLLCSGSLPATAQVLLSQNGLVYQLYNGASPFGSSVLGTGGTISLTSNILSANTTLTVKALKISGTTCESFLTDNVPVTVNANPVAAADVATTLEDVAISFNVTTNDTDACGINAATVDLDPVSAGIQTSFTVGGQGSFTVANTGVVTFTPTLNYTGTTTSVNYTVQDNTAGGTSNQATISVTVTPVNDEPAFVKGANQEVDEDAGAQTVTAWATSLSKGAADENSQTLSFSVTNNNNILFTVQPSIDPATGNLTYTLAPNEFGVATVSVVLTDDGGTANGGDNTFATQTFTITVNPVNDEPSFVKGADQVVNEDAGAQTVAAWATSISKGPANENAQTLTFSATNNNNALFAVQPSINPTNGTLTYTTAPGITGVATVTVILSDNGGTSNGGDDVFTTQTFTIMVNAVNDAPVAVNDNPTDTNQDTPTTFNVTSNDTDSDGTIAVNTVDLNPGTAGIQNTITNAGGTWTVDNLGNITFTPTPGFTGNGSVSYTVNDNAGATSNIATVAITVSALNAPIAVNDTPAAINEDTPSTFNVTANDTDANGTIVASTVDLNPGTAGIQNTIANSAGTWTVDALGNVTYTPVLNFNGVASVTYTVQDNTAITSSVGNVSITVNPVNDEPSFVKGANTTVNEDSGAENVAGWATLLSEGPANESGQTLTMVTTNNNNALFSVQPSVDPNTGNLTFTPATDAFGSATVSVVLSDNGGTANGGDDTFATQTFTITVNAVNDEPNFVEGSSQTASEDAGAQIMSGWATSISKGPGNEGAQILTFNVTNNNNSLFSVQPSVNATTGDLTYTPAPNAFGVATVTVILTDNGGTANGGDNTSPTQTFTITVDPVNDTPGFVKGANQIVNEDAGAQTIVTWATTINKGASNENSQILTFNLTNDNNALFAVQPSIDPVTGNLTYTTSPTISGVAIVSVVLTDDGGTDNGGNDTFTTQTFTITVNPVNDEPSFAKGADQEADEDSGARTVAAWASSLNTGAADESTQTLIFSVTNNNNALFSAQPSVNNTTGDLTYTLAPNAYGVATVSAILTDNGGTANGGDNTFATQTFTITVHPVNDEPSFVMGADQVVDEDAGLQAIAAWATSLSKGPANEGTQSLNFSVTNNNNALFSVQPTIDPISGNLTYTTAPDVSGTATVTVLLSDDGGTANGGDDTFTTQTFTITINAVNDTPVALNDAPSATTQNTVAVFNVTSNDTDADGTVAVSTVDLDPGTAGIQSTITNAGGTWTVDNLGNITFTPVLNFTGSAMVTYTVEDNSGSTSNIATVTITVNPTNTPIAVNDTPPAINEDTSSTFNITDNDTDSDGTIVASTVDLDQGTAGIQNTIANAAGTWTVDALGNITFAPEADFNGIAEVTYTVQDNGIATSSVGTVTLVVNPVNDEPSFIKGADDIVNEDSGVEIVTGWATSISRGPANENGQTLTMAVTNNNSALFSVQPSVDPNTGNLTYTPAPDAFGEATVTLLLTDNGGTGNGGDDTFTTQTFLVTIRPVNDEPTFTEGANQIVNEDAGAQTVSVWATAISNGAANESAQTLTFTVTTSNDALFSVLPSVNTSTGDLTYTPAADAFGTATVSVVLTDNGGTANGGNNTSIIHTFTITVQPVNDEPGFIKGADDIVNEDSGLETVIGWATSLNKGPVNEDGQILSILTTNDNNALFSLQPTVDPNTGNLTYSPAPDMSGVATVSVLLTDNGGTTNGGDDTFTVQTFVITVNSVNDEPEFVKGVNQVVNEDAGAQTIIGWATFISKGPVNENSQVLTFSTTNDNNSLFSVQPSINPTTGTLTYTTATDAFGSATVSIVLSDNGGVAFGGDDVFTTQTFIITVNAVNDAPVAVNDAPSAIVENTSATFNIISNDTDVDGTIATTTIDINPGTAGIQNSITNASGTWSVDVLGNVTFNPSLGFTGSASLTYTVNDNSGTTSNIGTISITVNPLGTPVALNDTPAATDEDSSLTFSITANDFDTDGTIVLTTVDLNPATAGIQSTITNPSGSWAVDALGNLTFTPSPNFNGLATVTYTIRDNAAITSNIATVNVTVNSVNDEPSFVKGPDVIVNEDPGAEHLAGWATALFKGPADEIGQTLMMNTVNDNNLLFSVQPFINPATGDLDFIPQSNAFGTTIVTVTLTDDGGTANGGDDTFASQTFTITINPVNDEPSFTKGADQLIYEDDGAQSIVAWATDINKGAPNEAGQTLTFNISNDNNSLFSVQPSIDPATGNLTYTPLADSFGNAIVLVTLKDDGGTANGGDDTFTTQTFNISINPVNDEPTFTKGADIVVNEDEGAPVVGWATSINKGSANESAQTLNFVTLNTNNALFAVQPSVDPVTGTLSYTLLANAFGSATVSVVLLDNGGTANGGDDTFTTQTFTITVNPVNDAPVAVNDSPLTNEDASVTFNATTNDIDVDGTIDPGTVDLDPLSAGIQTSITNSQGTFSVDALGNVTYAPALNFNGTATITYTVNDNNGATSGMGAISVTVNGVNDPPVVLNKTIRTNFNTAVMGSLLEITDGDEDGTTLIFKTTPLSGPSNGVLSINSDGTYVYVPNTGFSGTDVIAFEVCDSGLPLPSQCVTRTLTVMVNPLADNPPVAASATLSLNENAPPNTVVHSVSASDADSGDVLTYSITDGNASGAFKIDPATGVISVNDASQLDFETNAVFTLLVQVIDRQGNSVSATIIINLMDDDNEDSDQDGILDITEKGIDLQNPIDSDQDGIVDFLDTDDDNDGILTSEEDNNGDGDFFNDDCDGDGVVDYLDADQCKLKVELGFSPNGDGDNEVWVIKDIERYPNNTVRVFNRWGNVVYETRGYNNTDNGWSGQSNGKLIVGDLKVPDGTYFYVIDLGEGSKAIGGFVVVKR
jgi:gliding motility-associated-like protein